MARAALGEELTQAVFDDWRTAPVSEGLRAVLGLIHKLTLSPDDVCSEDVAAARRAGVSDSQIEEVVHICGAFNMIVRIADTLGFEVPDTSSGSGYGEAALQRGYT
jgi:alkylhydroperoxidase family enzyme